MLRSTSAFGCLLLTYWSTKYVCMYAVVTFYPIGLLPTKYIITIIKLQNYGLQEFMRKQCKRVEIFNIVRKSGKLKWGYKMANWGDYRGDFIQSNLETVRYSPKSEVSQIIWESWQHCCLPNSFSKFFYVVWKKCLVEIFVWCEVGFFGPLLKLSLLKLSSFVNEDIQIMVTLTKWIRHPLHSSFNRGVPWICFAVKMGRNSSNTCKLINLLFVWNVRALHQFHKHSPLSQLCFKQAKLW